MFTVCHYSSDVTIILAATHQEESSIALSARNHLKGEVTEVVLGTVTALITVKVGDNLVESVITKHSAEEMKLKKRRQGHRGYKGDTK